MKHEWHLGNHPNSSSSTCLLSKKTAQIHNQHPIQRLAERSHCLPTFTHMLNISYIFSSNFSYFFPLRSQYILFFLSMQMELRFIVLFNSFIKLFYRWLVFSFIVKSRWLIISCHVQTHKLWRL